MEVSPFSKQYEPIRARLVDAAVQYQCPFSGEEYIFVLRDAIYMPSMDHGLIPPFMLREAGIEVNERAKIHTADPTTKDHAMVFPETGLTIPLSLNGVFSYFPTTKPTQLMLSKPPDVYMLTPTTWNPHSDSYAINEESILDWEGNIKDRRHWEHRVVLDDIPENDAMVSSLQLHANEEAAIDDTLNALDDEEDVQPAYNHIPSEADDITRALGSISVVLDPVMMCVRMLKRAAIGAFHMSVGSTNVKNGDFVVDTIDEDDADESSSMESVEDNEESEALDPFGATPFRLEIDEGLDHPTFSRNYGTNDRMLRYRRINTYFYTDTFFATKKGGKSSRGNTCCQLFVTDKGYLYVVPMQSKGQFLEALNQLAKEVGAPDALICDVSG